MHIQEVLKWVSTFKVAPRRGSMRGDGDERNALRKHDESVWNRRGQSIPDTSSCSHEKQLFLCLVLFVVFLFCFVFVKKNTKAYFTTVHHHAFSYLVEIEEMKMGIQTAREACVWTVWRVQAKLQSLIKQLFELFHKLKPSEIWMTPKQNT